MLQPTIYIKTDFYELSKEDLEVCLPPNERVLKKARVFFCQIVGFPFIAERGLCISSNLILLPQALCIFVVHTALTFTALFHLFNYEKCMFLWRRLLHYTRVFFKA